MHSHKGSSSANRNKVMTPEQFKQVVEAITEGRYSWACVLILQFAGYNPVYFIPYRTYCRLVKENRLSNSSLPPASSAEVAPVTASKLSSQIRELAYLEDVQDGSPEGGSLSSWFDEVVPECFVFQLGLLRR